MAAPELLVFDTETTGTDPQTDQIIELTIQPGLEGAAEAKTWRFLPDRPIARDAERVHGISMADLADCPRFGERAHEVRATLDSVDVWVGYNLRFDLEIVQAELVRAGVPPLSMDGRILVDPFRLWQRMEPRSLQDAHKRFVGEAFDGAHGAAADVAATARVLSGMVTAFGLEDKGWGDLAAIAEPERASWIGPSNHLQWNADGEVVIGFGKNRGKPVLDFARDREGRGYLEWILRSDFPQHVKGILQSLQRSRDSAAWTRSVAEEFGPPPVPAAADTP